MLSKFCHPHPLHNHADCSLLSETFAAKGIVFTTHSINFLSPDIGVLPAEVYTGYTYTMKHESYSIIEETEK